MASYNKRISDQSKVKFNPINRELEDSENSELESRVDNLEENILGSKTATGNPITVTDAAPVNAVNLSMNLEPIQAGSGTPSPDNIRPISGRSEVAINRVSGEVTDTYTIQLGDTVYGGKLDVTRGKMVVDRGYVEFDGSSDEDWKAASSRNAYNMYCTFPNVSDMNISKTQTDGISNRYIVTRGNNTWNETQGLGIDNTTGYVRIYDSNFNTSDVNAWKTYLSNNPLQLIYYLATPFTIDLTPQQIKLLENTNTIYTDYEGDTITIEYLLNNAIGEVLGEVDDIYNKIDDIYNKIGSLDTRVTALEES